MCVSSDISDILAFFICTRENLQCVQVSNRKTYLLEYQMSQKNLPPEALILTFLGAAYHAYGYVQLRNAQKQAKLVIPSSLAECCDYILLLLRCYDSFPMGVAWIECLLKLCFCARHLVPREVTDIHPETHRAKVAGGILGCAHHLTIPVKDVQGDANKTRGENHFVKG